jgi:hypothetical protein
MPVKAALGKQCDLLHCGAVYTPLTFTIGDGPASTISGGKGWIATIEEES